jgi:hypothetical protein
MQGHAPWTSIEFLHWMYLQWKRVVGLAMALAMLAGALQAQAFVQNDTFVHCEDVPIFETTQALRAANTAGIMLKLSDFPALHLRRLSITCTFNRVPSTTAQVEVSLSNWQALPEKYGVQTWVVNDQLHIEILCPQELDLQPGALLYIRWDDGATGTVPPLSVARIDGLVITDNIDGFRQSWLPPARWLEKGNQ